MQDQCGQNARHHHVRNGIAACAVRATATRCVGWYLADVNNDVVAAQELPRRKHKVIQLRRAEQLQVLLAHVAQRQQHAWQPGQRVAARLRKEHALHLDEAQLVLHAEALQAVADIEQVPAARAGAQ